MDDPLGPEKGGLAQGHPDAERWNQGWYRSPDSVPQPTTPSLHGPGSAPKPHVVSQLLLPWTVLLDICRQLEFHPEGSQQRIGLGRAAPEPERSGFKSGFHHILAQGHWTGDLPL